MVWVYGLVGVLAIFAVHRFACWAEDRGWIYYRKKSGRPGTTASAFLEIQSMMEPSKKHVLEVMREDEDKDAQDDSGDPPKP
jgi:hypothetical protein